MTFRCKKKEIWKNETDTHEIVFKSTWSFLLFFFRLRNNGMMIWMRRVNSFVRPYEREIKLRAHIITIRSDNRRRRRWRRRRWSCIRFDSTRSFVLSFTFIGYRCLCDIRGSICWATHAYHKQQSCRARARAYSVSAFLLPAGSSSSQTIIIWLRLCCEYFSAFIQIYTDDSASPHTPSKTESASNTNAMLCVWRLGLGLTTRAMIKQ